MTPITPDDTGELLTRPWSERNRRLTQHWAEHGFGTPWGVHLVYIAKAAGFAAGAVAVTAATTPEVWTFGNVGEWWTHPLALQKFVIFTLLFEILGLGCGSGPLTLRFVPPFTAPLFWLRPGTVRLPPWPDRVPLTKGTTRTLLDVLLYAGVLAAGVWALVGTPYEVLGPTTPSGRFVGQLGFTNVLPLLVLLPLLGLRDKQTFLAARAEQYYPMVLLMLLPAADWIAASKWVFVLIWWGAATSKLNAHFPGVIAAMMSNAPGRPRAFRRAMFRSFPDDLRPSRLATALAHGGTVLEFGAPLLLLLGGGGILTDLAIVVFIVFHAHILSAVALGVPNEWNVVFILGTVALFGVHGDISPFSLHPFAVLVLAVMVAVVALGHVRPEKVSFLAGMRYYAGNWPATTWLFRKGVEPRMVGSITTSAPWVGDQLKMLYDDDTTELLLQKAIAWRSLHVHGRALLSLAHRAVDDLEAYDVREGEAVAGNVLGWNFGDGHLADERFMAAVQERCGFAPGDVRVVFLESQPMGVPHHRYRIVDLATGVVETGSVAVADMLAAQPWLADGPIPVAVDTPQPAQA